MNHQTVRQTGKQIGKQIFKQVSESKDELRKYQDIIHTSYHIMAMNFKNTRVLSFSELIYSLSDELNENDLLENQENIKKWYEDFIHFHYLDKLIENHDHLTEVFLGSSAYFKTSGDDKKHYFVYHIAAEHFQLHLEILAHQQNQNWNYTQPFASFFHHIKESQTRVTLTHRSLSSQDISQAFVRVIPSKVYPLENFNQQIPSHFFQNLINEKKNILIAGATGSGKTSFLSTLLSYIDQNDHLICLEDTKEIIAPKGSTQLLASSELGKTMSELCSYILRMSPNRVVLGEMRSHEIIPFFLMMNTGHKGLMSTIHSNHAIDAVHRCAFLFSLYSQGDYIDYSQALKMVSQNIDYVIYLKNRSITEVIKVLGSEKADCFYETICFSSLQS